jgi:MYXO-CTERM domain-containing protein
VRRREGALLLLAGVLLGASSAQACPEPEYVYGLFGHYPANGARAVPLDSPFVLYTEAEDSDGSDYSAENVFLELRRQGSDELTEVTSAELLPFQEGRGAFAFLPAEPLLPNTTYEVLGGTRESFGDRVVEATHFTVTTGDAARDTPLRIEGDWQVEFSPGREPVYDCEQCGPCAQVGTQPATIVRLTLPQVHDGFSDGFASATVRVTKLTEDGEEEILDILPVDELSPDITRTVEGTMALDDGGTYRACFTLEVIDGRGATTSDRHCTDEAFPAPPQAPSEPEPEAGIAGAEGDSAMSSANDARTSGGCSTSGHASGHAGVLTALALLGALSRRRRTRSAL